MRRLNSALIAVFTITACGSSPPPAPPSPPPPTKKAMGESCDAGEECSSGICEGEGCNPGQGICAPMDRACTMDLAPYCGCDGATFEASSGCPGKRYSARGPCAPPPPAKKAVGESCDAADECEAGICEGQGCGPGQGVCAANDRRCTRDMHAYCGCDGKTFRASGTCPGQRFSARKACPGGKKKKR